MALDLNLKQELLAKWQEKNFPAKSLSIKDTKLLQLALGMCEEAGEVAHEVLKHTQGIRSGVGTGSGTGSGIGGEMSDRVIKEIVDGVIDNFVYGLQILSTLGIKVEDPFNQVVDGVLSRDWITFPRDGVGQNGYPELKLELDAKEGIE